jgi:hypothetical protein
MREAGVYVGGDPLDGSHSATSVRVRDGKRLLTDGPFAETKEIIGGYYIIECANLDEAVEWAARCPAVADGVVEVRPIIDMGG